MKKIYISTSTIAGNGVVVGENIKKGEIIQRFKGKIKSHVVENKEDSISDVYTNWLGVGKDKWIEVEYPLQYVNHSCNPNSGIKGRVTIVALRNIKKDEEITIDYSTTESDDLWEMKCKCREKNCRHIIRSIQYLPERQFKKYLPNVPTYFKNLYLKQRKHSGLAKA